jgi:trigger factor
MKSNVEEISSVKKKLVVEIEANEVDKKINKAFRDLGKNVKIPGFRPGKIPLTILEGRFGKEVLSDVTRELVNESLPKALEETGVLPISIPSIENDEPKKGAIFQYSAVMEVKPEFELGDYKGLEVEKEILSITEEDIDRQMEDIRRARGQIKEIEEDRGVKEEDYIVFSYEGFENGGPIDGLKSDNHMLRVGSGEFHPEFEKRVVGLKKGDSETIQVKFEDDYKDKNLAGKTVDFKIEIMDLKEMELPELDDDFAKGLGGEVDSVEKLKEEVKKELQKREEKRVDRDVKNRIVRKICDSIEFELPESLVEQELNNAVDSIRQNIERSGSTFEQAGMDIAKLREDLKVPAEYRVKRMLVLSEIAKKNSIEVEEKDISNGFEDLASSVGQDAGVIRRYYEANNLLDSFKDRLLEEKTLNYLVEDAKVLKVEADKISKEET